MRIHVRNNHVSDDDDDDGDGDSSVVLTLELVLRNLERPLDGEPLVNVVRPEPGD